MRTIVSTATHGRRLIKARARKKTMIWTAVILACGLAGALGAATVGLPFWIGGGPGLLFSGYVAWQANFETPGNRDLVRAQRGEKDESVGNSVHRGRHRSSGDFPGHGGGGGGF